ncbi:hypothetical protein IX327_001949 [Porphyromonas levii]|nr:hypothetical protein [Porphyromonas levii]
MVRCSIPTQRKAATITDHEAWHQKIVCIWEASLCFEYLKTYLLPTLGGENPVGLINNTNDYGTEE